MPDYPVNHMCLRIMQVVQAMSVIPLVQQYFRFHTPIFLLFTFFKSAARWFEGLFSFPAT